MLNEVGLDGLTLRRLGSALEVDATAFYRHFPDKSALLRGVVRACLAEIDIPLIESGVTWEEWVLSTRLAYHSLLAERPYLVPLVLDPVVSWSSLPAYEEERQLMREAGFSEDSIRPVLDAIDSFVIGSAMVVSVVGHSESAARARALPRKVSAAQARSEFELGLRALLRGLRAELVAPA